MKRLLLFVFATLAFAACEQAPIEEQSAIRQDASETLTVGFEGADTRVQLNEAQKTVWNSGDEVSVFYRSNGNQKWKYKGEDGVRQATLSRVQDATGDTAITKTIVVYPYNETYWLNTDSYCIEATTPATQHYAVDSYGVGDNLMVSQGEFTQLSLKNVYGWLKLQLTGDGETIKSIKFRGNDGEQVAGLIYVDTATAEATLAAEMGNTDDNTAGGNLVFEDTILTEVTLDCGEGVALGKNATTFYIALPPQTFDDGFTVEVACVDGSKMVKSSNKALSIERNHIQPMAEFSYTANISPSNQIWYTSSDGNVVEPYKTNNFGANIISNTYNNGKGVITFDGDVTTIGYSAFDWCTSLTSVNIPDSVTTIGNYAFDGCTSLTSVTIPDSVKIIGDAAFYECNSLTSVTIPDSLTSIGNYAFYSCDSLTSVNIPDSVTSIGEYTFACCYSLQEFKGKFATDDGRSLIRGNRIVAYANASGTTYTIPDSVTIIGSGAFAGCYSLTCVNIPDSVTTIGGWAFSGCTSLTSVNIPDSVTTIGMYAFYDCTSLKEFTGKFAEDNGRILVVDGVLTAFAPAGITEYNIPDGVTKIGYGAFYYCRGLTSVNIPDSVTTIGSYAFYSCDSLTSVNIPDSVTEIGEYAFAYCTSLTSVNIPDSVTEIGEWAFYHCYSMTSVYCKATTPPALSGPDVFDNNGSGRKIYVPAGSTSAYKSAANWSEYADDIVGYDFENGVVVE